MKRILSLVLALSMVLSMFSFSFAGTALSDVEGTEYEAAVSALVELGVVAGYGDGTYLPEKVVTRAEMAKLLVESTGLKGAAEVSKGATNFSDVENSHWATGYINVAAQYGYINGYPEGTFAPDATVSYAEAVTMVIRALGYKTVVEAKGTWPTNYIAKAQELKVLEEVKYGLYTDGATRGNIALLMWNMLTTNMWDVNGENENNGLSYGYGRTMINKYFSDYTYTKVDFVDFAISEGKVVVELDDAASETKLRKADEKYEYAGADFFTFVPGTEVEVLVNEKSEALLLMIPTGEDTLVKGTITDLTDPDGNNYSFSGDTTTNKEYAYGILGRNKVIETGARLLDIISSEYVYEVESRDDKWVKINGTRFYSDVVADKDAIFVVDGTLGSYKDVEEGNVLTKVSVHANEEFYVVGGSKVSGKLEAYDKTNGRIEIGKEKYDILAGATYVIDPEDEDALQTEPLAGSSYLSDMKNEVVDAYADFFGSIVRVEFDGELGDEDEDVDFGFFAVKSWVEKASARKYDVVLENENGKDTYVFADDSRSVATTLMTNQESSDIRNTIYYVLFNSDNEIVNMKPIANVVENDLSGDQNGEKTVVFTISGDKYLEEKARFSGDTSDKVVKVSNSTYVVTIEIDEKNNKNVDVLFDRDIELLDNLDIDDLVTVVYETDNDTITPTAKYVIISDKVNATDSDLYGMLVDQYVDDVYGKTLVVETEDGEKIVYNNVADAAYNNVTSGETIIRYEIEKDEDDGKVTVTAASEIVNANTYPYAAKVTKVNGLEAELTLPNAGGTLTIDMADEDTLEKYEDYRILSVGYYYDDLTRTYEIESFEEISMNDVKFAKDDLFFDYTYITADDMLMVILSDK